MYVRTATTAATSSPARPFTSPCHTLQHDIPCVHCGYDLRGLAGDGLCPECGGAIRESVIRFRQLHAAALPRLADMPRAWVITLASGCTMLALLVVAVFVVTTVQMLIDPGWRRAWTPLQVVMVITFWLLAWPEPSGAGQRAGDRALRWSVLLGGILCGAWMILRLSLVAPGVARAAAPLYALLAAATTAAVMLHLARLAGRLPDRGLRLEAATLMTLLALASFCQVVFVPAIVFPTGRRWWTLPEPVIGEAAALILVPYALLLRHPWDAVLIFWMALAVLMVWTLALLTRLAIALWQAGVAPRAQPDGIA